MKEVAVFPTLQLIQSTSPVVVDYSLKCSVTVHLVSEPDPRKIVKDGLAHRLGLKCTLRNVRNFINC